MKNKAGKPAWPAGRYFKYAIGEIVLVVIGILIALSINNWNENNKNTVKEKQLLKELSLNLNSNIHKINQNISTQLELVRRIDVILDYMENGKPYEDSLAFHFRTLIYFEQITISKTAYEALKSLGFNLIQSDELRTEIINLFEMKYTASSNMINKIAMERYGVTQSMLNKYFRVNRERTKAVPIDYNILQQDQLFINWVYDQRAWEIATLMENKKLIEPTNALLDHIDNYLKN